MVILGGPLTGDGVTRADVGVGISATDKPEGVETALKAAYTDALKRCARTLGPSFGLALYEKERTTVGASSVAQNLLDEIEALNNADDCDAWVRQRGEVLKGLHPDDRLVVKAAFAERRQPFLAAKSAAATTRKFLKKQPQAINAACLAKWLSARKQCSSSWVRMTQILQRHALHSISQRPTPCAAR